MIITGLTKSRLSELKKYTNSGNFFNQYKTSQSSSKDGVDQNLSIVSTFPNKIIYYLGGITYTDTILNDGTTTTKFQFQGQGYNSPDFIDQPIYKDFSKGNVISKPKVKNDVFIVRQELSVFDKTYKLKDIKNLQQLTSYAGGRFFNIVSNT